MTAPNAATSPITAWLDIGTFIVLATLISLPFRLGMVDQPWLSATVFGVPVWRALLEGSGPIIATVVATRGFRRHWWPITFAGSSLPHAAAILAIPCLVFMLAGIPNSSGASPHLFGLMLAMTTVAYCVFEESGWRGYLQNALQGIPAASRYVLIGLAWYAWHLPFLADGATLGNQCAFLALLVGASFLLGRLADEMHSVFLVAGFHLAVNLLSFNQLFGEASPGRKLLLLIGCIVLWVPVLLHWKRHATRQGQHAQANPLQTDRPAHHQGE
jgi:hypothetical protein